MHARTCRALTAGLLTLAWLPGLPRVALADPAPRRVLVPPLQARPGTPVAGVQALGDFLVSEARRIPGHRVVSVADLQEMLSLEQKKQLLGCSESSCLVEMAGALDADEVLYGSVGRLGARELVLTLNRVDPRAAGALGGQSERLPLHDTDGMLDAAARALQRLYPAYTLPPPRVEGVGRVRTAAAMFSVASVMQYAAVATALFSLGAMVPLGVLGLPMLVPAVGFCVASPVLMAWVEAWLMDLLGRRQAGFRWAALAGALMVPTILSVGMPVVALAVLAGLSGATVVGVAATYAASAVAAANRTSPVGAGAAGATVVGSAQLAGLLCGALAMMPVLALTVLAVPAVQVFILMKQASPRPPGEDARVPGLWAPDETPWSFTHVLPAWLRGGPAQPVTDDVTAVPPSQLQQAAPPPNAPATGPGPDDEAPSPETPSPAPTPGDATDDATDDATVPAPAAPKAPQLHDAAVP